MEQDDNHRIMQEPFEHVVRVEELIRALEGILVAGATFAQRASSGLANDMGVALHSLP